MNKSKSYDKEIVTTPKNLEYMVQAVKGSLNQEQRASLFKCRNDTELFKCLWSTPSATDILSFEEEFGKKSESLARKAREKGNEYFKKQSFISALQEYNSSVVQAPYRDGVKHSCELIEIDVSECPLELALAYGNRSAALFQLCKFEECLMDIQRALRLNYPHQSVHKLLHRQGSCHAKLKKFNKANHSFEEALNKLNEQESDDKMKNSWRKTLEKCILELPKEENVSEAQVYKSTNKYPVIPDMKSKVHEEVKEASSCLRFQKDNRKQNVVLADDDLYIGDVLMVEKPFASVLFPSRMKKPKCYNCFSVLPLNPVPCYNCTTVVFCNESCRESSYRMFHKYECNYFELFGEDTCADVGHLVIRMFMTLGTKRVLDHLGHSKKNINGQFPEGEENLPANEVDTNSRVKDLDQNESILAVFDLEVDGTRKPSSLNNDEIIPLMELPFFACFLVKLLHSIGFLRLSSDIVAKYITAKDDVSKLEVIPEETEVQDENCDIKDDDDLFLIGGFLIYCLRTVRRFGKLIREAKKFGDNKEGLSSSVIGIGIYPNAVSKVQHSCDPSADIVHYNDVAVIRSIRKLEKGDEISISFGPLFHEIKLEPRRKLLWKANSLICNCIACYNKWPVLEEMFDELPGYRCEKCRSVLTASDKMDGKFLLCPVCTHRQNLEEIVERLRTSFDNYAMAMNDAMSGDHEGALPRLSEHLQLIQKHIRQPWPDLVACQTAVKLCYRLLANRAIES